MFDMYAGEPSLTELERKMIFVAELGEKSGNPFFYRGVYRGETKEDMLAFNSSIFLSIDQSKCEEIAGKLRENGVLLIRSGEEGTVSYTNYYYYVASFADKEKMVRDIGNEVLEEAIKSISRHPELMDTLACALVHRYKGWRYVNEEKITMSPQILDILIKHCLLLKNRFVYTGTLSGINFFIPDTPSFELVDHLNRKFLDFLFDIIATTKFGVVENYEEVRERILSDMSIRKLGLDSSDTQTIDYIFDLAESFQVSIPIRYKQLYEKYKESIINIKTLERISPLLRGSIETLDDSIRHYRKGTLSDYRLALINIDNSIELILRNHLLKKDLDIEDVRKISYKRLLKGCRDLKVVADHSEKFKQIHWARNQLYHMPVLSVVDKLLLKGAINLAKNLFGSETGEELKIKV